MNIFIVMLILLLCLIIFNNCKTKNYLTSNNLKLYIHTVFLPNENVYFLEEWIKYHLHIGFDKIYLYDNDGSEIGNGNLSDNKKNINRYGINYSKLFSTIDKIKQEYKRILNKYKDNIVHIKWQPLNEKNKIHYGYVESLEDYKQKYLDKNGWTAFIDIDEYIVFNKKEPLKTYIKNISKKYNKIIINQKKMEDRFCQIDKSIFDITNSLKVNTDGWAPKNICKNSALNREQLNKSAAMHNISMIKDKNYIPSDMDLFFNHYNVNIRQINWMKDYFKKESFLTIQNNSLSKHKEELYDSNLISNRNYNKKYFEELKEKLCYTF